MRKSVWLIFYIVLLTACNPEATTETAQQGATAVAPATATALPTSTSTATPEPTETAVPLPTATPPPSPTATTAPTETAVFTIPRFSVQDRFTIYGEEAAVPHGAKQFTDPGAGLFHNGQFHMFHNTFNDWPAAVDIAYSVSDDGIQWRRVQEEAVLTSNDIPFAGVSALAASALVLDDGTWVLYFYTWDDPTWPAASGVIGLATAASPLGPWTVLDEPILQPGSASEWDGTAVRAPSVVQTDDGFVMFYAGIGQAEAAIGQATSPDGFTWTKVNDPATESAPYRASDPVFGSSGEEIWDKTNAFQPHVQRTPDGLVMLYASATNVTKPPIHNRHGLAFSTDGIEWTRSDSPVFLPNEVGSGGQDIWFAELIYAQDSYFVYVELQRGNNTEVYVATLAQLAADE